MIANKDFQVNVLLVSGIILFSISSCFAADSISSRPVGVTTINIPANAQQLASLPYIPFVPTMDSLVGGQLPEDAEILMWNSIAQC